MAFPVRRGLAPPGAGAGTGTRGGDDPAAQGPDLEPGGPGRPVLTKGGRSGVARVRTRGPRARSCHCWDLVRPRVPGAGPGVPCAVRAACLALGVCLIQA